MSQNNIIILLSILVAIFAITTIKLSADRILLNRIIWIRENKHNLICYIDSFQEQLQIPEKYCINSTEDSKYVNIIFSSLINFIESKYFKKELQFGIENYFISDFSFLANMLAFYLDQHTNSEINGYTLHNDLISRHNYGENISDGFDATYSLTPFGIVYYKLYYISVKFAGNKLFSNHSIPRTYTGTVTDHLKKVLDTNTVTFSYKH